MSEENLAVARGFADAITRRDADWILERITDDFRFLPLRAATEGEFRGAEGIRRFLQDTDESFDTFEVSVDEIESVEDRVVGVGTVRIRGKGSGIETEVRSAAVRPSATA